MATDGDWEYDYDEEYGATITGYTGSDTDVIIPSTIGDNYPVTGLDMTFASNHSITSVVVPEGVTSLGSYTFETCESLASVTLPSTLTTIGETAFARCTSLESITIPAAVESMWAQVFLGCTNLTEITFLGETAPQVDYDTFSMGTYDTEVTCTIYSPDNALDGAFDEYVPEYTTLLYDAYQEGLFYEKLTWNDDKIQVESAIRDGNGVRIDTNYQRKPQVIDFDVPSTVTSGFKVLASYNGTYDGSSGYARFTIETISTYNSTLYGAILSFYATWGQNKGNVTLCGSSPVSNTNCDISQVNLFVPNATSYYSTDPPFLTVYNTSKSPARAFHVKITILEDSGDLIWNNNLDTSSPSTSNMTSYAATLTNGSSVNYANSALNATNASKATLAYDADKLYAAKEYVQTDTSTSSDIIVAIDSTGRACRVGQSNTKFPLPIQLFLKTDIGGPGLKDNNHIYTTKRSGSDGSLSRLSSSSYNKYTTPTFTYADGGKTLFLRGSLDSDGYFIGDNTVTLSMEPGYTYIPFGIIEAESNPAGSSGTAPSRYSFNGFSAKAYTLDSNGKLTHIDGQEISGGGTYTLNDVSVTFALQATPDYAEFPYCAEVTAPGVTPNSYASVTYSNDQSQSLLYAPTAVTGTGVVKIYARQDVGTVTIPSIAIGIEVPEFDDAQPISSPVTQRTLTLVSSSDTEYPGFPYKYSFPCVGATATRTADVTFDVSDATSGNFVPICETGAGALYIWAKTAQATARIGYMLYYTENAIVVTGPVGDASTPVYIDSGGQAQPVTTANMSVGSATNATNATNATYLGSSTANVGSDTKPVKIVNGVATAVTNDLQVKMGTVTSANSANLPSASPKYDIVSVTAPISGRAVINIRGGFANNSAGYRLVGYAKNTTSVQTEWLLNTNSNADYLYYSVPLIIDVNAGDVIHGCAYQTSGSTLNCSMGITMMIYPM